MDQAVLGLQNARQEASIRPGPLPAVQLGQARILDRRDLDLGIFRIVYRYWIDRDRHDHQVSRYSRQWNHRSCIRSGRSAGLQSVRISTSSTSKHYRRKRHQLRHLCRADQVVQVGGCGEIWERGEYGRRRAGAHRMGLWSVSDEFGAVGDANHRDDSSSVSSRTHPKREPRSSTEILIARLFSSWPPSPSTTPDGIHARLSRNAEAEQQP